MYATLHALKCMWHIKHDCKPNLQKLHHDSASRHRDASEACLSHSMHAYYTCPSQLNCCSSQLWLAVGRTMHAGSATEEPGRGGGRGGGLLTMSQGDVPEW